MAETFDFMEEKAQKAQRRKKRGSKDLNESARDDEEDSSSTEEHLGVKVEKLFLELFFSYQNAEFSGATQFYNNLKRLIEIANRTKNIALKETLKWYFQTGPHGSLPHAASLGNPDSNRFDHLGTILQIYFRFHLFTSIIEQENHPLIKDIVISTLSTSNAAERFNRTLRQKVDEIAKT